MKDYIISGIISIGLAVAVVVVWWRSARHERLKSNNQALEKRHEINKNTERSNKLLDRELSNRRAANRKRVRTKVKGSKSKRD